MDNVIVTGGSRGIGLAIVRRLAADGWRVIAIARRQSPILAGAVRPDRIEFRSFDLGETAEIPALVKSLCAEFGPIGGLVNNAAIGTSGILATMRDRDIERLVRVNTLSPILLTKHVARSMLAAGAGGRIVNVASIAAATGFTGLAPYAATKASLVGFTRSLARELGPARITVNAVAPGFVDTDMTHGFDAAQRAQIVRRTALNALASAEDIANAVAFLMSAETASVTGTVVTVDAGTTA